MKQQPFFAGTGRAMIELPTAFFPTEGFNGIHDVLYTRVLLLQQGVNLAIVSLELTSLPTEEVVTLQRIVATEADLAPEQVWICVTHTFSAPHIRREQRLKTEEEHHKNSLLRQAIGQSVGKATMAAVANRTEARFGVGAATCSVNVNRDISTVQGWWLGSNDAGLSDKTVTVLRFENLNGELIAILFNYAVQSSVMEGVILSDGERLVSGDLAGAASRYIEQEYNEQVVAMYCIGAAGDQAPAYKARYIETDCREFLREQDVQEQGFILAKLLGNRLGTAVVLAAEKIVCSVPEHLSIQEYSCLCPSQEMPQNIWDIQPSTKYEYVPAGEREVPVAIIRIENVILVGVQPELCCCTFLEIKAGSVFPYTIVCTLVNGSAKYMADQHSYMRRTYEAMNSPFAVGAAELLRDKVLTVLRDMQR